MANVKISELPSVAALSGADEFALVQSGVTYKGTLSQLLDSTSDNARIQLATTADLGATYDNGSSGVGATLTNSGALAALTIDGVLTTTSTYVIVKDQTNAFENGIYQVSIVGDGVTAWVMTRTTFYDTTDEIEQGDTFTVYQGTANAKTQWLQTDAVSTIGTDAINFESNVVAGTGITKTNNTLSVSASGINWNVETGTSANLVADNGYFANNGGLVTFTLPTTASVGDTFQVCGMGAGGWAVAQNASQFIKIGSSVTSTGVGGSLASTDPGDCIKFVCRVANTEFMVTSMMGSVTVV